MRAGARGRLPGVPVDVLLVMVVVIWSFNFSINRYGVTHGFDPVLFAGIRYLAAGLLFTLITLRLEGSIRPRREDWFLLGVFAILGTLVNQVSFFYSIKLATASTVALAFGALPAFVGLIGIMQRLERPSPRHWLAVLVSFSGVALVAIGGGTKLSGHLGGVLLAMVAVASFALYTVSLSRLNVSYSPYRMSAMISLGVSGPLLAAGVHGATTMDWQAVGGLTWGALAYSTIIGYVISNILWIRALGSAGPNRSSLYVNMQVFGGAAVGVLLLGESMSGLQITGGAVIAVGILLPAKRLRLPRGPVTE